MFSAIAKCSTKPGLLALLLVVAGEVAAQAPHHALALTTTAVHAFAEEREMDLLAINAFEKQRTDNPRRGKKMHAALARPGTWTLYGRVGPMRFTNQFDAVSDTQLSLRGNAHGLKGRLYVGVHTRF